MSVLGLIGGLPGPPGKGGRGGAQRKHRALDGGVRGPQRHCPACHPRYERLHPVCRHLSRKRALAREAP